MQLCYPLVHYEVNDFDELAQVRYQLGHSIIKRSALDANVSSTASPSKSVKTTPNVITIHETSSNSTTGKPSAKTTVQSPKKPTTYFSDSMTYHPSTKIPRGTTSRNNPTTRFPILSTTSMPVNNTNGTNGTNITISQVILYMIFVKDLINVTV